MITINSLISTMPLAFFLFVRMLSLEHTVVLTHQFQNHQFPKLKKHTQDQFPKPKNSAKLQKPTEPTNKKHEFSDFGH